MNNISVSELRKVVALSELPDEHLQWILDRSDYREYSDGQLVVTKGEPMEFMWIILEGATSYYMDMNGTKVFFYTFANDEATGGVGGLLPYSRMKVSPGYSYAVGNVRYLTLDKKHFSELEKLNSNLTQKLIAYMTDRARVFATLQLQQEKVSALGKLSAGIAHELNNPAAAINRISQELTKRLILTFDLTEKLLFHCVNPEHLKYLRSLIEERVSVIPTTNKLSARQKIEIEDDTRDWLENHNIDNAGEISDTFVESGVTIMELEKICKLVEEKACSDIMSWMENMVSAQKIINDLEQASGRISNLVDSIKSHVHMDRTNDIQPTNIRNDIENTITLLGHKLREKKIEVVRKVQNDLPQVDAFVGELNQVWMNIIDNAIFAMDKEGQLTIEIYPQNTDMKINITDNGHGIPANILPRIFDPFFTTKKVGEGTGIGLDIVSRIIKKHMGDIKVHSEPGRTVFMICLPIHQKKD